MRTDIVFGLLVILLVASSGLQQAFAEKTASIQETVNVGKDALINAISSLDSYQYILPDYIKSSSMIEGNTASMKVGTKWINTDADVKFSESDGMVTLEVISGDFKGTKLGIVLDEVDDGRTRISAEIRVQTSWFVGLVASFVTDENIESILHSSMDDLVEYAKDPMVPESVKEEKFCIFGLCF